MLRHVKFSTEGRKFSRDLKPALKVVEEDFSRKSSIPSEQSCQFHSGTF